MTTKERIIAASVAACLVGIPTLAIGGSKVVSMIQGKDAGEAVQIVAEQTDALSGRVDVLEERAESDIPLGSAPSGDSGMTVSEACSKADELRAKNPESQLESAKASYDQSLTATAVDYCRFGMGDYKCVGGIQGTEKTMDELMNELRQNYGNKVTADDIQVEFISWQNRIRAQYDDAQKQVLEYTEAVNNCSL